MSRLFGYDFWFKNRRSRFPFGGRHPYRNMYRLIASLILLVYILISSNNTMKEFNESMKTAMIATGELSDEERNVSNQKSVSDMLNMDKNLIKILKDAGFGELIKNQPKIVVYSEENKNIEAYANSSDWNTKFAFIKISPQEHDKSQILFKKVCGEICIVDTQNKKYFSIPKNKANDEKYIYEAMSKFYN